MDAVNTAITQEKLLQASVIQTAVRSVAINMLNKYVGADTTATATQIREALETVAKVNKGTE